MWVIEVVVTIMLAAGVPGGGMEGKYDRSFQGENECLSFIRQPAFQDETKKFVAHALAPRQLPSDAQVDINIKCVVPSVDA